VTGGCHCGAVHLSLRTKPAYVNDCNCSLCSNAGALWGYFAPSDVSINGETQLYTRLDRKQPGVTIHFCGKCGAATHWSPMPHIPQTMMGANMRLFDPSGLIGVELRFPNGRDWDGQSEYGYVRDHLVFGTA
jgi:hypothetical protein